MEVVMRLNAFVTFAFLASTAPLAYANPAPRITPTPQASYVAPLQQRTANTKPELRVTPTPQASYVVADPSPGLRVIPTPQASHIVVQPRPGHQKLALRMLPTPQAKHVR